MQGRRQWRNRDCIYPSTLNKNRNKHDAYNNGF